MQRSLLLILLIQWFFFAPSAQARQCIELFALRTVSTRHPVMRVTWELQQALDGTLLFGRTNKSRKKELEHIASDLTGVEEGLIRQIQEKPYIEAQLTQWLEFNQFWLVKLNEYKSLPLSEQKKLKKQMEIPMSIALKHFISFLEAPHHRRWKFGRLEYILTAHVQHPGVDLEASLFLIDRASRRYYSGWDFTHCRY